MKKQILLILTAVLFQAWTASGAVGLSVSESFSGGFAPTGTITFTLFGPDNAGCSGSPVFTSVKAVSGGGTATSDSYVPTTAGIYRWMVAYSGDANHQCQPGLQCARQHRQRGVPENSFDSKSD